MAVVTESALRSQLLNKQISESTIKLPKGAILTPAAKSYLQEKKITIEFDGETKQEEQEKKEETSSSLRREEREEREEKEYSMKYRLMHGGFMNDKPEHMTSLHSNLLVHKDHKRIILRGKLDSLQAKIIEAQMKLVDKEHFKLVEDLSEVLDFVRAILRSEVLEEQMHDFKILNMNEKEIREKSHYPEKYFNEGHFYPDYQMGAGIVLLNAIRTFVREVELVAYQAYKKEDGSTDRDDLILALNRLSSLFWVMMIKVKIGYYAEEKGGKI